MFDLSEVYKHTDLGEVAHFFSKTSHRLFFIKNSFDNNMYFIKNTFQAIAYFIKNTYLCKKFNC